MLTLTFIFSLFSALLTAPPSEGLTVFVAEPARPYEKIIHAIGMVETKLYTLAYNPEEQAVGFFQIRPIRLKDYNDLTGNHYTIRDMYDYQKAEKVFLFYAMRFHYSDYKGIAKDWNKSRTDIYWNKVKKQLYGETN